MPTVMRPLLVRRRDDREVDVLDDPGAHRRRADRRSAVRERRHRRGVRAEVPPALAEREVRGDRGLLPGARRAACRRTSPCSRRRSPTGPAAGAPPPWSPNAPADASATAIQMTPRCTTNPPYRRGFPRTVPTSDVNQPVWSAAAAAPHREGRLPEDRHDRERRQPEREHGRERAGEEDDREQHHDHAGVHGDEQAGAEAPRRSWRATAAPARPP